MHIKQVIIRGFKTYKDQTSLDQDFSPGVNVVVGFNGSGKSNFFQAILFVLSDQYSSLRAETRKALLHEGAGQAVLTAYVEVVLDNTDRRIPVENDQVAIRRLIGVKKDDWLLDGKHATKAEIFGLLEGAGFAKTSPYYIVQQGKVSELTLMTDAQRLGLLKDISGAGVFDERRAESVRLMEDTAVRQSRAEALIGEISGKLAALENEQRELRECEDLESQKRTLDYVLADREWRAAQDRINELRARHDEASAKLVDLQNQVGGLRKRAADTETGLQQQEDRRANMAQSLASLESERDRTYEELTKAQLEVEEEARRRRTDEDVHASRLAELGRARAEMAAVREEINAAQPQHDTAEARLRELEQRVQVASAQRDELLGKQGRKQQFSSVEARNSALDEEIRRRTAQLKEGRRKLEECSHRLQKAEDKGAQATEEAKARRQDLASIEGKLSDSGKKIRYLGEQLDSGAEQVRLLHQERGRAARHVEELRQEALASQHRLEGTLPRSYRQALTAVMAWAKEQGLQDRIKGPLISHIEVSPAFRGAVESFAGMGLFNVLATDDEAAAQAVKFVRTKRLGTIVVSPLSQLRLREFDFPEIDGVKPLVDVVSCADWVRPAVQQVFGRSVVCRNMELCEQVSRVHNIDAISLDGDRVSRRGVVTGGYQDPQRFVRLALAESIRSAHARSRDAEEKLPEIEERVQATSGQMDTLHGDRRAQEEARDRVRVEMQRLTEEVQGLETMTSKCARDVSDFREWKHRMEVLIGECEASIEAKKNERASKKLSGLSASEEEKLETITSELQELTAAQEAARSQLKSLRASLDEKEAQLESSMRTRLHELETEAARGSEHEALERAEEAVQRHRRLERQHREASDGAEAAAKDLHALAEECAAAKVAREELAAEEQRLQDQAAQASLRVDQLLAEVNAQAQKKTEVDGRLQILSAPMAEVEKRRDLPKAQLIRDLADVIRALAAFQHVNRKAVEQYENFSEQLADLRRRKEEVDAGEAAIAEALRRVDEQKDTAILQTLERVNEHFQQVFAEMVPGGAGKLHIIRDGDESQAPTPASGAASQGGAGSLSGVRIEISFTGQERSFLLMNQLSGGQKTVCALSLIFAIQRLEPAPFYLLDEVDAALDASYRSALASLVAKTASSSQVILTTFRPEALEKADSCYRVYQQNRASRIDAVGREQAKQVLIEQDRLTQVSMKALPAPE